MTGIIEKRELKLDINGGETTFSGRDLMGIVVDSCLSKEDCVSLKSIPLKKLAQRLLGKLPFLADSTILFMNELADAGVGARKPIYKKGAASPLAPAGSDEQLERAATVFDVLADKAQRHGLIFWLEPDGTFVFGRPQGVEAPFVFDFHMHRKADRMRGDLPHFNNVASASLSEDISKVYSDITVVAQAPGGGDDAYPPGGYDQEGTAALAGFPYQKPLVVQRHCTNAAEARALARIELYKRLADSWRLKLAVPGFSQDGTNYRANAACRAAIEPLGVDGKYLVLGRRYTYSAAEGQKTELEIGKLMEGYVEG
jgi:prophage tail gpP-like protein